jgi:Uma2 family endonuclease
MAARLDALLTAAEYGELPEIDGYRDELIEGERVLSAFPKIPHLLVIENLEAILEPQFPDHHIIRESGWYFQSRGGRDNVPGPDLMVLSESDYARSLAAGQWFEGTPLFVIEVISPSERKYRRLQKVALYLEAGAGAVVEADLGKRIVLIHRPEDEVPDVVRQGRVTAPFTAELSAIFARLP